MQQSIKWEPLQSLPKVGAFYEHRNGLIYKVIALARDQDREEILVIHEGPDGVTWSRTVGNFMGLNSEGSARFRVTDEGLTDDSPQGQLGSKTRVYGPRGQCKVHGCEDPATTPDGLCSGHFY